MRRWSLYLAWEGIKLNTRDLSPRGTRTIAAEFTSSASDGLISIREGQISIQDPQAGGKQPVIAPGYSVHVFVNEEEIHQPTEIAANTHIRLTLPVRILPECEYDLEISEDDMQAWLTVHVIQAGYRFRLLDIEPSPFATIHAEKEKLPLTGFPEIGQQIQDLLKAKGIVHGLEQEKLMEAQQKPGEKICIAAGSPPVTRDDEFVFHFRRQPPDDGISYLDSDKTYAMPPLQICQAGDCLVTRTPGAEVSPGRTIFGEEIPPRPPQTKELLAADRTVRLDAETLNAFACIEGVPSFNGREARVMPLQTIPESVDGRRQGAIDFKGSVQIEGDVLEHSQIWAEQNIEVGGNISHAQLEAEENLIVRGRVVRGTMATGGDAAASMRLIPHVEELLELLQGVEGVFSKLKATVPALQKHPDKVILINLIKTQFSDILSKIEQLWEFNKALKQLHPRKTMVLKVVLSNLLNMDERDFDSQSFKAWIENLTQFLEDLQALEGTTSDMYLTYVQGSTLTSSGNIYVVGEGCYNSELVSHQAIYIIGEPGYFREGSLTAETEAYIKELGSPNASTTRVNMSAAGSVFAKLIYPGATFCFAREFELAILEPLHYVRVYLEDKRVRVEHMRPVTPDQPLTSS